MKSSIHATTRAQQRGIPPLVIDLLMQYGNRVHHKEGAEIVHFDKRSRKKLHSYVGGLINRLDGHLNCYAVVANGKIVTVGHRFKRIKTKL